MVAALLAATLLAAQPSTAGFDSIALQKPKEARPRYELTHPSITELSIKTKGPRRSRYTVGQAAGDAARQIFAGVMGSFGSSQDVAWQLQGFIETNADSLNWQVDLFCPGELEKNSERVRNSDGSRSIQTEKTAVFHWDRGASGILLEKGDTIGRFIIRLHPQTDSLLAAKAEGLFEKEDPSQGKPSRNRWMEAAMDELFTDYALAGTLHGKTMMLFYNARAGKSWIYTGDNLAAFFQSDKDVKGVVNVGKKAVRVRPYLLLSPNVSVTETADYLRLALVSRYIADAVAPSAWPMD